LYNNAEPVVMKLGKIHFKVKGDSNIPLNTIQLSSKIVSSLSLKRIPQKYPVFIAKPEFTKQILKFNKPPVKTGIENI